MTLSGLFRVLFRSIGSYVELKKEENEIRNEIFKIREEDDISYEDYKEIMKQVYSLNQSKLALKQNIKDALNEYKDDTYHEIKEVVSKQEPMEYEETPSFRDKPKEIKRVIEKTGKMSEGLEEAFREKLNTPPLEEYLPQVNPGDIVSEKELLPKVSEDIVTTEKYNEQKPEEQEGLMTEVTMESSLEDTVVLGEDIDKETEVEIVVEEIGGSPSLEEDVENVRNEDEEVKEDGEKQNDSEIAKEIIERINNEDIKFTTKEGKELKKKMEEMGYIKDLHYKRDKDTRLWYLR